MEIDRLKLAEMKRADVLPDVVGLWLVFPHSDGVAGQGRIVGTVPDGKRGPWIVVQHFCVVTGEHDEGMRLCRPADLRGCFMYRTAEEMEAKTLELYRAGQRRMRPEPTKTYALKKG